MISRDKEDSMIEEEVDKYIADFVQSSKNEEIKLLNEIGALDEYLEELKYTKRQEILCRNRMNNFIELAFSATGEPYIIDTGSSYDAADALFDMTDKWLSFSPKTVKDLIIDVILPVIVKIGLILFAVAPIIIAFIAVPLTKDPRHYIFSTLSILTILSSISLWVSFHDKMEKRKKDKIKKILKEETK